MVARPTLVRWHTVVQGARRRQAFFADCALQDSSMVNDFAVGLWM